MNAANWVDDPSHGARLEVRVLANDTESTLAEDVLRGLTTESKSLPPKHFYDDVGSELFDRICETEEYYQTRTELRLLKEMAPGLMDRMRPTDIIELGSGAARKTRALLDAAEALDLNCRYVPFDVSEGMLRRSADDLLGAYPWLRVAGVVGDYDRHLGELPSGERRLFVFLGGTIGNFEDEAARAFLDKIRQSMTPLDCLLLGTDLVKSPEVLNRAYNDASGVTADFNKNVLRVVNRELDASFDLDDFEHVAFYDENAAQIEMHLEASRTHTVPIRSLGIDVELSRGERILTEISRKFSRDSVTNLLERAGLEMMGWHVPRDQAFALSVSRQRRDS